MVNEIISDRDPALQVEEEDFSPDVDSTPRFQSVKGPEGLNWKEPSPKRSPGWFSESGQTVTILPDKGKPLMLSKRDVEVKRHKTTKKVSVEKKEERPQCSKMANTKILAETRRVFLAPASSSEEENDETEMRDEVNQCQQQSGKRADTERSHLR